MPDARRPLIVRTPEDGPAVGYRAFVPPEGRPRPPLVLVHGKGRRADHLFRAFLPTAVAHGVPLIAPVFAADRFGGYQSLAGADGPLAAMNALLGALEDASWHMRVPTDRIDLFGFSGGAQFAHRFAMLAPSRVRRVVSVSAGWYTYLDVDHPFPRGAGASVRSGGREVDVAGFLDTPVHVLVGERDVERDGSLRAAPGIDRRQGPDRLTRALRWTGHLEDEAIARGRPAQVSFDLLPGTGHSFTDAAHRGGVVAHAFRFLHPAAGPDVLTESDLEATS